LLCAVLAGCVTLKERLENDLRSVNYQDGVSPSEANVIAQHYRLNNMKWYAFEEAVSDGDYWSFKLIHGRTYEPVDEPPLLIYKNAWSYKSAVVVGGKPLNPPQPPGLGPPGTQ
jgi:hypothetical protein